ncbi:MAG: hypothetical protein ACLPVF_15105 [Acidimicrobiales bacterium]
MTTLHLDDFSRSELAELVREYMITAHVNDRTGLAAVQLDPRDLDYATIAIEEWMGASPIYTRRMQRALGFAGGEDVATIFKGLQLDCGFAHQYMDVRYEVESAHKGRFWLESCGALLDVEPHGQDLVFTMCHTIEDPTFDATAVATNRRAQTRPVHRPPRVESSDSDHPHCEWTVTIDPAHNPVADHPLMSRVERSALAGLEVLRPTADPDDDGLARYDGPVLAEPQLELFSRDALVTICKEVAVQVHLLVRALGLSVADAAGPETATEILAAEMVGSGWIMSERLARLLDVSSASGSLEEIETVLSLHPMFQPAEYQPIALEREGDALQLHLLDGPARADDDGASWSSLLRSGRDQGLVAATQAINRRARVEPIEGSEVPSWTITLDPEATPVAVPDWVAIGHLSGSSKFAFEQRVSISKRQS